MRSWFGVGILLSAFGAAPVLADPTREALPGSELRDAPAEGMRLRLVWVDVGDAGAAVFEDAARELKSLFGEASIAIEWQRVEAGKGTNSTDLHVIVLETAPGVSKKVMGVAQHAQEPPPTVRVFVRHVRHALGLDPRSDSVLRPAERALLGRAIGRVVAHEIVHVYAPDHGHEARGLMRARLDATFLRQEQAHLEPTSVCAVVKGLAGGSTGTAILAPQP